MGGTTERRRGTGQRLTISGERLPSPSWAFRVSVGWRRRRWRGRCAWAWVSGADVKLLFGHPSDRWPRRLPVSAKSVRGHRPRRGLQARTAAFFFVFAGKLSSTCLPLFWISPPHRRAFEVPVVWPQGDPTSDWGGHLTLVCCPAGNRDSLHKICILLVVPSSPASITVAIRGRRGRPMRSLDHSHPQRTSRNGQIVRTAASHPSTRGI